DFNLLELSLVVGQTMRVKQFLPTIAPTLTIVTSPLEHPSNRIVGLRRSGPGPDHVRMEDSHERVNILSVPGAGLAINDRFDLFTDVFHRMTTESVPGADRVPKRAARLGWWMRPGRYPWRFDHRVG